MITATIKDDNGRESVINIDKINFISYKDGLTTIYFDNNNTLTADGHDALTLYEAIKNIITGGRA